MMIQFSPYYMVSDVIDIYCSVRLAIVRAAFNRCAEASVLIIAGH